MNKPFGWYIAGMIFEGKDGEQEAKDFESGLSKDGYEEKAIPLYTHPVKDKPHPKCDEACMYLCQMRELTDEEITEVFKNCTKDGILDANDFAKAILRKAQEK